MSLGLVLYQILKRFSFVLLFGEYTPISSMGYRPEARGYVIYSPCALPKGRSPRATHEGNESHNHELKAGKWLIFTLARILQGMQKYTEEKLLYCSSFFCFLTLHAGTSGIHKFLGF